MQVTTSVTTSTLHICDALLLTAHGTNVGGWNQEPKRLRKATVVPNVDAKAHHPGEGRVGAFVL